MTISTKRSLISAFIIASLFFNSACKKAVEQKTETILEQYFEQNVLNRDFRVNYALDDTTNLTAQYSDYIFRLEKDVNTDSNTEGPMFAKVSGNTVCTGTWSCTEEFGKLTINLITPATPSFIFLNRSWKFTEKAFPIMKLAPWGVAASKTLYMQRL